ncbi:alpha-mannosidase-like isoform X2 [Tasmannia lanceolata]|uniref:alpha-mannosidase-like isoform X2 n=1 Tax=Tasmannia lanceolata TaxID=3420 RepID=UPI004063A949
MNSITRMKKSTFFAFFLSILATLCGINGGYINYNTSSGPVEGKLNVHLVPHSHDDVGWLKTVDQYYVGLNNSIQGTSVRNVLDSVVVALMRDPNRKFVFVEQAFFQRWWREQNVKTQEEVRKLVDSGQLEFINGGWCMHDEATCHYIDMIDQTTLGHYLIKKQFNKAPRVGWQIDAFGHSAVQSYLFGAELGFDALYFARIDYQDRAKRKVDKSLEVIWRGSKTFGSSSQIFTGAFPVHYNPPTGFSFELNDGSAPVQDDTLLYDYNVEQRVNDFIDAARNQANVTRTNHIMWTMGDDFQYQYAESWFKQMDKFIHYVNRDGQVNAFYSTPSIYTDAKNAANESWPLKTDDYFPYADAENAYWTGFFSSRPSLKGYVRMLSGYYLAARQLEFLAGRKSSGPHTFSLGDALGTVQHHDAVSGTSKQHTTNDYVKRLALGASHADIVVNLALSCLTNSSSSEPCTAPTMKFGQCHLLNISYCPPTEEEIPEGKSLVVVAYNPLGWIRSDIIRIPVNDDHLVVRDSAGNAIDAQYVFMDNATSNFRNFYTKAYLGVSSKELPKYWFLFQVSIPPFGWSTYFISKADGKGTGRNVYPSVMDSSQNETFEVGPGDFRMSFSLKSGQLKRITNYRTGVDIPIQQSYLWYGSSTGDVQDPLSSGAYVFRPIGSLPGIVSRSVPLKIVRGPLVDEVHQNFSSWIYQVTRLYRGKDYAEVEFTIGPVPLDDGIGKEVITRIQANMATDRSFYTDSNGRDFLKRVRDYRADWPLQVHQPIAGNYYPINLGIYIADEKSELSVLVDRATGGASLKDGQLELMLHRRMLKVDFGGLGEALDENICVDNTCEGLTIRGNYYMSINKLGTGARWRRTVGQQVYSPLLLAFTHEEETIWKASHVANATFMDPNYSLPPNVALITLQIKELKETSLSANQEKSEMRRMNWRVEGDSRESAAPMRGGPVDNTTLVVELGPMEIRTFLVTF